MAVPGHWSQTSDYAEHDGPFLYRHSFAAPRPEPGRRHWLTFDGVLSSAEIWFDGSYLGDTVGYFARNRFEITDALSQQTDHLLAVDVSCPPGGSARDKATLTGALQTGPLAPPGNPGGIWRPVSITETGAVAIRHGRLFCTEANTETATLQLRLVLDSADASDTVITTTVTSPDGSEAITRTDTHSLAAGENRLEWRVEVEEPELWWPSSLSDTSEQPLYAVTVTVAETDGDASNGRQSDQRSWTTGLRTITMKDLTFTVNGRRLFAKSVTYGPAGPHLGQLEPEQLRSDLRTIKATGFDMVRVYGHVTRPEFYDEADRLGILVWQDMPLIGGYSSKVRSQIRAVARALVDHLGHHPSVALWCGHCEPNELMTMGTDQGDAQAAGFQLARQLLPSWNRSLLDPLIGRELRNADPSRSVLTRSATLPSLSEASDAHLWLGWRAGRPEDLATTIRRWPRLGLFAGGIGSQSAAVRDWPEDAPTWPTAETTSFNRYLPRTAYPNGQAWAAATRSYQADVLRTQIETMRRLKYRPSGGFCITAFADPEAAGGFGIVDFGRLPKPAHNMVIDACRPVIVVADQPPTIVVPEEAVTLAIHAISDLHRGLGNVAVTATATASGWRHSQTWSGDLGADTCEKIADFSFSTPKASGQLIIDLELESDELVATNRYQTVIIPAAEAFAERS